VSNIQFAGSPARACCLTAGQSPLSVGGTWPQLYSLQVPRNYDNYGTIDYVKAEAIRQESEYAHRELNIK